VTGFVVSELPNKLHKLPPKKKKRFNQLGNVCRILEAKGGFGGKLPFGETIGLMERIHTNK